MSELVLCKMPAPENARGWEPCPLERGHDGPCCVWGQAPLAGGRIGVDVRTVNLTERVLERRLHATLSGEEPINAEQVCALVALMDLAAKKSEEKRRGEEADRG